MYIPHVIVVTQTTLVFFVSLSSGLWAFLEHPLLVLGNERVAALFAEMANLDPFRQSVFVAADGSGLNPLLRHPGMVLHPPMLYLGYVGFVVPFAFATGALAVGDRSDTWLREMRRWVLLPWLFLSLGLMLGMWWAYGVLGWGGYWGWDPVENAALMPWLTATAFLHSSVVQERRGLFKAWNLVLLFLTYGLVIFGTFVTRSGVVDSVHAFALSGVGPLLLIFFGANLFYVVYLLFSRFDRLADTNQLHAILSRESLFLLNNILFLAVAFVTFWGTIFPVVSDLMAGQKAIVGAPFFNRVNGPLLALLVILMGVAPLMPWKVSPKAQSARNLAWPGVVGILAAGASYAGGVRQLTALPGTQFKLLPVALLIGLIMFSGALIVLEYWRGILHRRRSYGDGCLQAAGALLVRNQRRYGGYLVHLGVVLMALAVVGTNFLSEERQASLSPGDSVTIQAPLVGTYSLTYTRFEQVSTQNDLESAVAVMQVRRNDRAVNELRPRRDLFVSQQQVTTVPAIRHTLMGDLYVVVAGWEEGRAAVKVYAEPLVNWLWIGGLVFVLGTVLALWPHSTGRADSAAVLDQMGDIPVKDAGLVAGVGK